MIVALTALAGHARARAAPRADRRAARRASLPAASYLAQGAFKELFEAAFLLAFALWLWELGRPRDAAAPARLRRAGRVARRRRPLRLLGAGRRLARSARSPSGRCSRSRAHRGRRSRALRRRPSRAGRRRGPARVVVAPEAGADHRLRRQRRQRRQPRRRAPRGRRTAVTPPATAGLDRQLRRPGTARAARTAERSTSSTTTSATSSATSRRWRCSASGPAATSGSKPGDGAVPAPVFYLGAPARRRGARASACGAALRERETRCSRRLIAALAIWLGRALCSALPTRPPRRCRWSAPVLMLIALRGVLAAAFSPLRPRPGRRHGARGRLRRRRRRLRGAGARQRARSARAATRPGSPSCATELAGMPMLLLAPAGQLAEQHGAEFYGWELRGAQPICVAAIPEVGAFDRPGAAGDRLVVTTGGRPRGAVRATCVRLRTATRTSSGRSTGAGAATGAIDQDRDGRRTASSASGDGYGLRLLGRRAGRGRGRRGARRGRSSSCRSPSPAGVRPSSCWAKTRLERIALRSLRRSSVETQNTSPSRAVRR